MTNTLTQQLQEEAIQEFQGKFVFSDGCVSEHSAKGIQSFISQLISDTVQETEKRVREETKVTENTSDGYHTFKELYEFRKLLNAQLFNEWSVQGKYSVHKSYRHGDGELAFGGGWFIVMATLPTGQISFHYENKDWDLFNCEIREKANVWDGHTPQDVLNRLTQPKEVHHDQ